MEEEEACTGYGNSMTSLKVGGANGQRESA